MLSLLQDHSWTLASISLIRHWYLFEYADPVAGFAPPWARGGCVCIWNKKHAGPFHLWQQDSLSVEESNSAGSDDAVNTGRFCPACSQWRVWHCLRGLPCIACSTDWAAIRSKWEKCHSATHSSQGKEGHWARETLILSEEGDPGIEWQTLSDCFFLLSALSLFLSLQSDLLHSSLFLSILFFSLSSPFFSTLPSCVSPSLFFFQKVLSGSWLKWEERLG